MRSKNNVKKFVMKWAFADTSVSHSGHTEKHFNLFWRATFTKYENGSVIGLECLSNRFQWFVGAKVMVKMHNSEFEFPLTMHTCALFNSRNPVHTVKVLSKYELKHFSNKDGTMDVEIQVKIAEINIGSGTDRRFDDDRAKEFSDVALVVKGQKFYVSKMYLSSHSPFFNALLNGHFSESGKSEVELKGIDPYDFQNFLELLHGETLIFDSTFEGILNLADMYECVAAIRRCEQFLIDKSSLSVVEKLEVANEFGLENAKKMFKGN